MTVPTSVKGVVTVGGRVVLLRNERSEWELPGGRVEAGESLVETLVREIDEELGCVVTVDPIPLDDYEFEPIPGRIVHIVTFGCRDLPAGQALRVSDEHVDVATFTPAETHALTDLPEGYQASIRHHLAR